MTALRLTFDIWSAISATEYPSAHSFVSSASRVLVHGDV
jgi:hypothetical protein